MDRRALKQLFFAGAVLVLAALIAFIFWRVSFYKPGSCVDHIQNQDEIGVDCGGVCPACVGLPQAPKVTQEPQIFPGEGGTYDVVFRVENINPQWGIRELPYVLMLKDVEGNALARREGRTFVLPLENRMVVEQAIPLDSVGKPISGEAALREATWVQVSDTVRSDDLVVLNTTFTHLVNMPETAEVRGIVRNDSPFSYDRIEIFIVVSDSADNIISVRRTEMRTLSSGERREFRVAWRTGITFPSEPRVMVDAFTNVFENENFVQKHGIQEQFQELR